MPICFVLIPAAARFQSRTIRNNQKGSSGACAFGTGRFAEMHEAFHVICCAISCWRFLQKPSFY